MSNDVVPDWAITTSAHLLKRRSRDGGRRMVVLVPKKWQKDQMQEILQLIEYFIYNQAASTPRNRALFRSSAVGQQWLCFF